MPVRSYGGPEPPAGSAAETPKSTATPAARHADPAAATAKPAAAGNSKKATAAPAAAASGAPKSLNLRTTQAQKDAYAAIKDIAPLPGLQEPRRAKIYTEATLQDSLYPIIENHDIIMVAGAFFGDEGKGKTVDAVAHHPKCTCIARVNSGENAGHTVYDTKGRKFVFNLAPSGLLVPGKKNYVGPECVMDPVSFMEKEIGQLIDAGVEYHDRLFIGNVCIVTPYHKLLDLLGSAPNSSTLKGMSPSHASKVSKRGIRLDHIFNDDEDALRAALTKDLATYNGFLKEKGLTDEDVVARCEEENSDGVVRVPDYVAAFAGAEDKVQFLVDFYRERVKENPQFPPRADVSHELREALRRSEKVLLEGPQSYWLSNAREKFWATTTSADTSAAGLLATSQINFQRYRSVVINVHKAPGSSRVGIGACPSSFVPQDYFSRQGIRTLKDLPPGMLTDFDAIQRAFYSECVQPANGVLKPVDYIDPVGGKTNIGVAMAISSALHHGECGAVTKKPRVVGFFDCVLHHEVNAVQGPLLSISALDRGDDYDKIGLVIGYVYYHPEGKSMDSNGRVLKNLDIVRAGEPAPNEAALYYCHPIVKVIKGWKGTPIAASKRDKYDPLPSGVCDFINAVEYFTKCKVLSIGNGPNGSDIIYLRQ